MKPKAYFALRTFLIILSTAMGFLFVLYLMSFILFSVRMVRGSIPILFALPWLLIFLSIILIVILEVLVRHFSFAYRRPILYIILGIIIIVLLGSFLINKTQLHPHFFQRAEKGQLPIVGPLYRGYGGSGGFPPGAVPGFPHNVLR